MARFPKNPTDGMIWESSPSVYFQYNAKEKTWVKLEGFENMVSTATPMRDGLMSKEDYKKLMGLMIPPPRMALTSEDCNYTFKSGVFGLRSSDESVIINYEVSLMDIDTSGQRVEKKQLWKIHENTFGIDFKVNMPVLIYELEKRGKINYHKTIGPQGKKGKTGPPGIDYLETGPIGEPGDPGKNAPFSGTLSQETSGYPSDTNRGIIDLSMEVVSPNETYLVAVRSNIGNPDYCPSMVNPKPINSKWIVVIDEQPVSKKIINQCDPIVCGNTCSFKGQGQSVVLNFCSTSVRFLDISLIEEEIKSRFYYLLDELKTAKEQLVKTWLNTLVDLYNEQKLAVCCAIENCESRRENARVRARLEDLRAMIAGQGQSLVIDGDKERKYVDTDPNKTCPPSVFGGVNVDNNGNIIYNRGEDSGYILSRSKEVVEGGGCTIHMIIRCDQNAPNEENALIAELPAGVYKATVSNCCGFSSTEISRSDYEYLLANPDKVDPNFQAKFDSMLPYTGYCTLISQSESGPVVHNVNDLGWFRTNAEAVAAYSGNVIEFTHSGGEVKAYFTGGTEGTKSVGNAGEIDLCIQEIVPPAPPVEYCTAGTTFEFAANCAENVGEDRAVVIDMKAGTYEIEIHNCCCFDADSAYDGGPVIDKEQYEQILSGDCTFTQAECDKILRDLLPYTGEISFTYNQNGQKMIGYTSIVPHYFRSGQFKTQTEAQQAYVGKKFTFKHDGGEVKFFFVDKDINNSKSNSGEMTFTVTCISAGECGKPTLELTIDCDINATQINAVSTSLAAGNYRAEIGDCCCVSESGHGANISFNYLNSGKSVIVNTLDRGHFNTEGEAHANYIGNTFLFSHSGGDIAAWSNYLNGHGVVKLVIKPELCYNTSVEAPSTAVTEITNPEIKEFTYCDMSTEQIQFYEAGWRSNACCGALVEAGSSQWIVVLRSIGTDTSCGGGESINSDCIKKGLELGGFYPAIAYPTIDGQSFLGKPVGKSYQRLARDLALEAEILNNIKNGRVIKTVNNPMEKIQAILFPSD